MKFKETKIGFVPKDWEKLELKDIIEIKKVTFNPSKSNEIKKCIELEHINQEIGTINGYTYSNLQKSNKYIFRKGDILFGKLRAYLKKFWKAKFNGVCSSEIWVFNGKKIINDFLFYFIQQNKFIHIANVSIGSKMPRADWNFMSNIPFLIPPLKEQQKIAKILLTCDEMIEKQEKLIKEKEKLKKALMQKLLNVEVNGELKKLPKVRFKEFSGEWENVDLEKLIDNNDILLGRGEVISKKDIQNLKGNYPIYSSSTKNNGLLGYYGKYMFDEKLITWSIDGGGDFFYRPKHKFSITNVSGFIKVLNKEVINTYFLSLVLQYKKQFFYFDYQLKAHPSVIKKLYKFYLPPTLKEQEKIADVFLTIDKEIDLLKLELEEFKKLKKSLMQKLLTGKVRVRV